MILSLAHGSYRIFPTTSNKSRSINLKKKQLLMFSETELRHASGPNDLPVTEPQENQTLCARQQDGEYLWTK